MGVRVSVRVRVGRRPVRRDLTKKKNTKTQKTALKPLQSEMYLVLYLVRFMGQSRYRRLCHHCFSKTIRAACCTYSLHCQIANKNPSKRWIGEFWGFRICVGWISTTGFCVVGFYVPE